MERRCIARRLPTAFRANLATTWSARSTCSRSSSDGSPPRQNVRRPRNDWRCYTRSVHCACSFRRSRTSTCAADHERLQASALPRQWIRPELEMIHLARGPLAAFHMEGGTSADGGPETTPLPAAARIIDATVHPLGVETHRIRDTQYDPLSVLQHE